MNASVLSEVSPGPTVFTDEQWEAWLTTVAGTEFHPSCSCSMLPLDQGGVVDPNLKVYGLANVRVADSSVFPIQFAAHLMAPTYGLAEQAADIIKSQYNGTPSPAALQTPTTSAKSTSVAGTGPTGSVQTTTDNHTKSMAMSRLGAHPMLSGLVTSIISLMLYFW
ncbi:hypothetical protein FRB99_008014 [Tulasnella sp. 403]|nr:hypothetical protein FRB99_008014 [Tulasnella sp. 403]